MRGYASAKINEEDFRPKKMAVACGHSQGQVESPSRLHVSIFGEPIRLSDCVRVF